jgi:hypothetical protein
VWLDTTVRRFFAGLEQAVNVFDGSSWSRCCHQRDGLGATDRPRRHGASVRFSPEPGYAPSPASCATGRAGAAAGGEVALRGA